jgi:hypothetical protein
VWNYQLICQYFDQDIDVNMVYVSVECTTQRIVPAVVLFGVAKSFDSCSSLCINKSDGSLLFFPGPTCQNATSYS